MVSTTIVEEGQPLKFDFMYIVWSRTIQYPEILGTFVCGTSKVVFYCIDTVVDGIEETGTELE